jgi:hypothetical protein
MWHPCGKLRANKENGLTLTRRERWPGTLAGIREGMVYWQCPDTIEPIAFRQSAVEIVRLPEGILPASLPKGKAAVELVNGDLLTGDLGEMDREKLSLRPWGLDPLEISRRHIATVRPQHPDPQALDVGPSDLWSRTPPATQLNRQKDEGVLYLRRQLKLPDRLCLEWHSTWNDPDMNLRIAVFLKGNPSANEGNEYFLAHFTTGFAGIIPFPKPPQPAATPTPAEVAAQEELNRRRAFILLTTAAAGHAHFALYADRQTGEAYLFCNDQLIAERNSTSRPSWDGVWFISRGPDTMQVRHVVLREWRGAKADLPTRPPTTKQDRVQRTDASWLCDAVQGIRTETLHATGKKVPLAQVTQIAFPAVPAPPYRPRDIKVVLHNGDVVTLALAGSDAQRLVGKHPLLGSITIVPAAVSLMDFLPDFGILTNQPPDAVAGQSSQVVH